MLRALAAAGLLPMFLVLAAVFGVNDSPGDPAEAPHVPGEVILKFKANAGQHDKDQILSDLGGERIRGLGRIQAELRRIGEDLTVEEAVSRYRNHPKIQYIEPNYIIQAVEIPNDPRFNELWGLRNTGQTGGTAGADIRAVSAWDNFTGSHDVLIGNIDTGVDYTHPDLAANMWINPGEVPGNGIDDDGNGFIDDVHGWDFYNNDNDPMDDNGHGTHTAGTIGAVGDNGVGVVGVNWNVRILPIKFLSGGGSGSTDGAIAAVEYATLMGVRLTSNSWGGGGFSQALSDAIADAGAAGILFVAAAGNNGSNTDVFPHYPSSYPLENIVAVAATDHNDQLAGFSNYGAVTVDLAAPGVDILSTFPGGTYGSISGTSMATPHVSGALGLVFGRFPSIGHLDAKALLLNFADPLPSLSGLVLTGARLNAFLPTAEPDSIPPGSITDLSVGDAGSNWLVLEWSAPGDDGATGSASRYEVKVSTSPITEADFDDATDATGPPDPDPAGTPQTMQVAGLQFSTPYYLAVKAFDEFGNASPISNLATGTTLGAPDAAVAPELLTETLVTGSTSTQALTLSNVGEGTLDFTIPSPTFITPTMAIAEYTPLGKDELDTRVGAPVVAGSGGPDGFGYRWTDSDDPFGPTFNWVDISGTGTVAISGGDDINVGPFPIGFPFEFYGVEYSNFRISSNGLVSFTSSSISYSNQPLPNPDAPLNMVAPFWDDLYITPGLVYYRSEGSRLIVQWHNIEHYGGGGPYTFQLILSADGSMVFQYLSMGAPTESATIGIQNAVGDDALQVAFNTPYVHDQMAIRIQAVPPWLSVSPAAGSVRAPQSTTLDVSFDPAGLLGGTYEAAVHILSNDPDEPALTVPVTLTVIGAPDLSVSPVSIDFGQVFLGGVSTIPVQLDNPGTDILHVSSISSDHADYQSDVVATDIPPRESRVVNVSFSPLSLGATSATMTISSDDPDTPIATVALTGEGIEPPIIGVAPGSLSDALFTGSSSEHHLTVTNTGGSALAVSISVESVMPNALSPEAAVAAMVARSGILSGPISISGAGSVAGDLGNQVLTEPGQIAAVGYTLVPATGFDVAVLGADYLEYRQDVQSKLLATGRFNTVTSIDVGILTPTLAELEAFDGVIVYSDFGYQNPVALGNNLADYVDGGGGVVCAMFEVAVSAGFPSNKLGGRWESGGYFVLNRSSHQGGNNAVLGSVHQPGHPTMEGVASFDGGYSFRPTNPTLTQGAIRIADWSDGNPLVAVKEIGGANRVDLGFFPPSSDVADNYWQVGTDGDLLMANALEWSISGVVWLSVQPEEAVVPPQGTLDVQVTFDAHGLNGGSYDAFVVLTANDPLAPIVRIPAHLDVTGAPDLALSSHQLDFGTLLIGDVLSRPLVVRNEGTDLLTVTGLDIDHGDYTMSQPAFNLAPGDTQMFSITFAPTSAGSLPATLTVHSNDPDTPAALVALTGAGLEPPDVGVTPAALSEALFTGDTSTQVMTVYNTGLSDLHFMIDLEDLEPVSVPAYSPAESSSALQNSEEASDATEAPAVSPASTADPRILVIQDTWAWGVYMPDLLMSEFGLAATVIPSSSIGVTNFDTFDLIITVGDESFSYYDAISAHVGKFEAFASAGGVIQYQLATQGSDVSIAGGVLVDYGFGENQNRVLLPNHPLAEGLPAILPGNGANHCTIQFLPADAQIITDTYTSNRPTTVEYRLGRGHVIATGMTWEFLYYNNYVSGRMLLNAITYSLNLIGPGWLSTDISEATVPPGGMQDVAVTFDADGLFGGAYNAGIVLSTNDPDEREVVVPAHLQVTGVPRLELSAASLDFGTVFIYYQEELELTVQNTGTEVLSVYSMAPDLSDYFLVGGEFSLVPGQSRTLLVRFQPSEVGDRSATLTIHSDDPYSPHHVSLIGAGVLPPVIGASPDAIVGAAMPGGTKTKTLQVCNTGGSDLLFSIGAAVVLPPPPTGAKVAAHVKSHAASGFLACTSPGGGGEAPTDIPCSQYATAAPTFISKDVYVVVAGVESPGVLGLSCGISYDPVPGRGVDLYSWTYCGDGLEFPSATWPASGSGNRMTWLTCESREVGGDGIHAIAGAFYVYAYGPDTFRVTENTQLQTGPELKYASCNGSEIDIPVNAAGSVRFSPDGSQPGFNPCVGGMTVYSSVEHPKGTEDHRIGSPVTQGQGGPDAFGYTWKDSDEPGGPVFSWTDISGTGIPVQISGDDYNVGPFPIGFAFEYYGTPFNSFRVCTNGWISFTSSSAQYWNQPLPNLGAPENLIAAFWEDLYVNPNQVFYQTLGNRLIVQYQNVPLLGGGGTYTFQIILEATGAILFQYLDVNGWLTGATVGVQNGARDDGLTVAFNTPYVHDNLAVRISAQPAWLTIQPESGTVPPGECMDVSVMMDATELPAGDYEAIFGVNSNDPVNPSLSRPVTFHVGSVEATDFDVDPNTLNLGSNGRWISAYVEIPLPYAPEDVLVSTVKLNGTVAADPEHVEFGDFNENGVTDLAFKFDRDEVAAVLGEGESIEVLVTGEIEDLIYFTGTDHIRVIRPSLNSPNGGEVLLAGSRALVQWTNPQGWQVTSATLTYSADNGANWTLIAQGVTTDQYVWEVPAEATEQARVSVFVFDEEGMLGHDGSDQSFAIRTGTTGVDPTAPSAHALFQNIPNPFKAASRITFDLPAESRVQLSVFDISGRAVRTLEDRWVPAGRHEVLWDGRDDAGREVGSGVYFYWIEAGNFSARKSMTLMR